MTRTAMSFHVFPTVPPRASSKRVYGGQKWSPKTQIRVMRHSSHHWRLVAAVESRYLGYSFGFLDKVHYVGVSGRRWLAERPVGSAKVRVCASLRLRHARFGAGMTLDLVTFARLAKWLAMAEHFRPGRSTENLHLKIVRQVILWCMGAGLVYGLRTGAQIVTSRPGQIVFHLV